MSEVLTSTFNQYASVLFLYIEIFVMNYILLNLFLAILLNGFTLNKEMEEEDKYDDITFN